MDLKSCPEPVLYPYQRKWIMDKSRFKIGMFARQTGKTFATTLEIALDMVQAEMAGRAVRWVILSRGERQAIEAMEKGVKLHLRAMSAACGSHGVDLAARMNMNRLEVAMQHGSRVTALPANPDTARGFSANVFLDEFAFHQDSAKIWSALYPVISKPGLRLRVTSTPNGNANKFYELMTSGRLWSRHVVDIYRAVEDGLPRNIGELREGCGDSALWAQEFELEWLDEATAWLPLDLIASCEDEEAGNSDLYAGGPVYVGCDIGRRRDLFVIWVLEDVDGVAVTREIIARRNIPFAEQDRLMDNVFSRYRVARLCMDQSGMGEKPVEDASRRYGAGRVEGVLFTSANRLALATCGKAAFERRAIKIPADDRRLRADLHKLKREASPTGNPRFVADSDSEGHADRAWACFLALMAMDRPKVAYGYRTAGKSMHSDLLSAGFGRGAW